MQRRIALVGAAVYRCAFLGARSAGVARGFLSNHARVASHSRKAVSTPLAVAVRQQATVPDKRFHCSVCKKSFRLEMAAKLHLQQVHGGDGTVEAGSGPGQPEEQAAQPLPIGVFRNAPPQEPTVVTASPVDLHERSPRREKPAPKPLHEAEREVPTLVMDEMLGVWDDVGVKRIGTQFVHSSMVMRVFAAKPSDSAESLYGVVDLEGESPFENAGTLSASGTSPAVVVDGSSIYRFSCTDAFAMATEEAAGPFRPAACPNPFLIKTAKNGTKSTAPKSEMAEPQTAPLTPFGQLPLFGTPPPSPPTPPAESSATEAASATLGRAALLAAPAAPPNLVSSPFASSTDDSPFAGTATSPFAAAAFSPFGAPEETATGDAAATAESPFAAAAATAAAVPSPFTSDTASAAPPPSPFAGAATSGNFAPSPFASAGDTAANASFSAATATSTTVATSYATVTEFALDGVAAAPTAPPPRHTCSLCGKSFITHDGLRAHSVAKHGLELPKETKPPRSRNVPDLPAYIPSPVDLTMTSPFGSAAQAETWADVELTPYAQSVSNITIAGRVIAAEISEDGGTLLSVLVRDPGSRDNELVTLRCSAEVLKAVSSPLVRGDYVFACGTLRLLPMTDAFSNRLYTSPLVHVTTPTGILAKLNRAK